jgi:hypothetical protein
MTYLNFNKIIPPKPNDPTVDEVAQLNNNWDLLDAGLKPYIDGSAPTFTLETGQERFDGSDNFAVWDGAALRAPDDSALGWSAWTNIPMLAPRAIRTGFQPKWRSNSLLRKVELTGGIQADNVASAWTMGSLLQFNSLAAGSPANTFGPIGGKHVAPAGAALTAGTSVTAAGYIVIDVSGSFVRMSAQYLGGGGGGNFIQLEQVWWWY